VAGAEINGCQGSRILCFGENEWLFLSMDAFGTDVPNAIAGRSPTGSFGMKKWLGTRNETERWAKNCAAKIGG